VKSKDFEAKSEDSELKSEDIAAFWQENEAFLPEDGIFSCPARQKLCENLMKKAEFKVLDI
jgi:hypothetical protein